MNPYIGDRELDPPEYPDDEELEDCMPDMSDPGEPTYELYD